MRSSGAYKTKQREFVLECIKNNSGQHLTAEDIIDKLKENGTPVGKSTVYRYLNILVSDGAIKKYELSEGFGCCFQYTGKETGCNRHYHLKCTLCGELFHAEDDMPSKMALDIMERYGFEIDPGKIVLYGRCKGCCQDGDKRKKDEESN